MTWPGEKQKHAMSARGIKSAMPEMKRTMPTKRLLGEDYEWVEIEKDEAFDIVDEEGSVVVLEDDIWQAYRLEPTDKVVIVLKVPHVDPQNPHLQFIYQTIFGTVDKLDMYQEDTTRYFAEDSLRKAKWRSEYKLKEIVDLQINGLLGKTAREKGITEDDVDPEQLKRGTDEEMEHTSNRDVAKIVALDHIAKDSEAYND